MKTALVALYLCMPATDASLVCVPQHEFRTRPACVIAANAANSSQKGQGVYACDSEQGEKEAKK